MDRTSKEHREGVDVEMDNNYKSILCRRCNGTGEVKSKMFTSVYEYECRKCSGKGSLRVER